MYLHGWIVNMCWRWAKHLKFLFFLPLFLKKKKKEKIPIYKMISLLAILISICFHKEKHVSIMKWNGQTHGIHVSLTLVLLHALTWELDFRCKDYVLLLSRVVAVVLLLLLLYCIYIKYHWYVTATSPSMQSSLIICDYCMRQKRSSL